MALVAVGINHRNAPVELRERVAFAPEYLPEALRDLVARPAVNEAAILSTCNRTELYCGIDGRVEESLRLWLGEYHRLPPRDLHPFLYTHPGPDAVRHMLRVASGLDSMVLGEPQILGQMKAAFRVARHAGTLGKVLSRLFEHTFAVAKQVRTDTSIGASPVSVAFAAVTLAKQIFGDLGSNTALLIGAGETIELAARHLHEQGIGRLIVANRTAERAHALAAQFRGYAIALSELPAHLAEGDVIISATGSALPILGKGSIERALRLRRHRPVFIVDIAVPRDVEPEVGELADVYLYSVDDLEEIIEENLHSRRAAATQAEEIIDAQVQRFMDWVRGLDATATIRMVRSDAEVIRDRTLDKAMRMLVAGKAPQQALRYLAYTLTNRLMHAPSVAMKNAGEEGRRVLLDAARELFNLREP